ncbi:LysE family translocator [Actinomadura sp. BRA 177]|uniref:LysE family translocator n=1 Tax=Actinomadura sp. BRA 177 TaxID=2745202 RepID=UPI001595D3A4|nr:LysE family translocator [Actinomadura sp. BRA 177]NVI88712.1 LysE family translocator [Actinomadura sp. BRA 177]
MTNPLLFLLAALTLVAIPGPNHLYITTRSIGEGRRAGVASALGVETGTLVHIAAAAAGLSALVAASATAFGFLRYAGAAYLVYLAYRTLRSRHRLGEMDLRPQPIHRVYLDGALVNVLNPKVVLFFLAFLPQFVDQDAGAVPLQIAAMGLATALIGLVSDMGYALAAGSIGTWLRTRPTFQRRQQYLTSLIYLTLGAATLFAAPTTRHA